LQASDFNGMCLSGELGQNNFKAERLDFQKYITMSCSMKFANEQEFKSHCTSGNSAKLKIFA